MEKLKALPSLSDLAYERLRDSILNGYLQAGNIYIETNLAHELGISRTPVREALLRLASQGLVSFIPRKGVQISHFTVQDIDEVFEMRKAIEIASVEKLSQRAKVIDFSEADKALSDQTEAVKNLDKHAFLAADRRFHAAFAKLTGNRLFALALENLRDKIYVMSSEALTKKGRMKEVMEEHEKILKLIRQGRLVEVKHAMTLHLDRSRQALLDRHFPTPTR